VNRLRAAVSPELVAALLSVLVVATVIGIRAPTGSAAQPDASASPSASARPTASDPLSALVRSALETVVVVNGRLAATSQDLAVAVGRAEPRGSEIAVILPRISAQVTGVTQPVSVLVADPLTASLGSALTAIYQPLTDAIRAAQRESVQNTAAYVKGGKSAVDLIQKLAPLTATARALLAGHLGSASPAPSAAVTPAPSRSASASSPSPPPSSPPRSPSPTPPQGGLIVNPGFEDGVAPWALEVVAPAAATIAVDATDPGAGAASARVVISSDTGARSAISLTQSGIALRAGQTYTIRLVVRAATARDLRIRLAATNGDTYVARILPVTTAWATITFTYDSLVDDPAAVFGIDLGRSSATTWIDAVSLSAGG
jgi:hypothetical protein